MTQSGNRQALQAIGMTPYDGAHQL